MKQHVEALLTAISSPVPDNGDTNVSEGNSIRPLCADLNGALFVNVVSAGSGTNGNRTLLILTDDTRTASVDTPDVVNQSSRGGHFIVNVSAITGSPSITVKIQGKDSYSGEYYDVLVSNPITAVGVVVLKVYPGIGKIAGGAASDILPMDFRASIVNANGDSITYSISATLGL